MPGMEDTGSARPHITRVLTDKHHLDYFKEFLRLQDRRLLTLHKEIRKFRSNVQSVDSSSTTERNDTDEIRDQLLFSALNNVTEITRDSVNIAKRTAEELNAEGQRILRSYSDVLNMESQCIHDLRKKLEQGKVSDTELANIELHVESILDSKIDAFVLSRHYKALMVEVFTDPDLSLDRILSFADSREIFKQFMSREKSLEVLSFYLLSSDFRSRYDQMNHDERQQNALLIYQKLEVIGFSDSVRSQVKNDLQTISPDLFKLPVRQALTTLQTVYLPLFLRSIFFRNYLNELIEEAGLTRSQDDSHLQPPKSDDASSTSGIDLGTSFSRPELIYYRPLNGHLYLGHIDSLGRYRSETLQTGPIQRILAAREKERKKYTFSRLIGSTKSETDKAEEEAWKTARMIIADITSFKH